MPKKDTNLGRKPKPHDGPKEREMAVALTVAILQAADVSGDVAALERTTLDLYRRILVAVAAQPKD